MLRYAGHWAFLDYGYWHVSEKSGGFVGEVGFADFHRDMTPSLEGTPEIGWCALPSQHGKGLAREAVSAALDWAKGRFHRTGCIIGPENIRSIKLAEKLGFERAGMGFYKDHDVALFYREL